MIHKISVFWRIFKAAWATRKGDYSEADMQRRTDAMMAAAGLGKSAESLPGARPPFSKEIMDSLYDPSWEDMRKDGFVLTSAHIDLIKRANLVWSDGESGAPMLDTQAPYTGGSTTEHLTRLLGDNADEAQKRDLLVSMVQAFAHFCSTVEIQAGDYDVGGETITLTDELITLVRHLEWDWPDEDDMAFAVVAGEIAGPRCDCKRPYGDMSFFALDIHRILGWEVMARNENGYIQISDEQIEVASDLHDRILGALGAVLAHGASPEVAH